MFGINPNRTDLILDTIEAAGHLREQDLAELPDGSGSWLKELNRRHTTGLLTANYEANRATWTHYLEERTARAAAESDEQELRDALVDVAALALAWAETIEDR